MRPGVSGHQVAERVGHGFEERIRDADRQGRAEGVAQPPGVFDAGDAGDARDGHRDGAPLLDERLKVRRRLARRLAFETGGDLRGIQGTEEAQEVGHALDPARPPVRIEPLRFALELRDDLGVEKLPHLDLAEELAQ